MNFQLSSPEFQDGATLPPSFQGASFQSGESDSQSPVLEWTGAPAGTKSFVITMCDPDAPTGVGGWWHWMVVDIPGNLTSLARNAGSADGKHLPAGARTMLNDGGTVGWMGCYPPVGDPPHKYLFTIYALDCEKLDLPENATTTMAGYMANLHAIGKATLHGFYAR